MVGCTAQTTMMQPFDRFIAIDWSGAKGSRHKGIAVAIAEPGDSAPQLVTRIRPWSRTEIVDWLIAQGGQPLVGFDFSFAPPFISGGTYLPGTDTPVTGPDFWAYVDSLCAEDEDLGAASFLERTHRSHFYFGAADGRKADYMRLRACEKTFNAAGGGKPSSIFDAIGAAQVAKASFAGMRVLNRLHPHYTIWPFEACDRTHGVVVEIYTRAFIRLGGMRGLKLRDIDSLNSALCALGSQPHTANATRLSDHETDVLVSAAGLRRIASVGDYWSPAGLTPAIARSEGWTFGVV